MLRVQHVDTKRDLLQQWLGLATVVFHTAAGANQIPALPVAEAGDVRDRIAALARTADELRTRARSPRPRTRAAAPPTPAGASTPRGSRCSASARCSSSRYRSASRSWGPSWAAEADSRSCARSRSAPSAR